MRNDDYAWIYARTLLLRLGRALALGVAVYLLAGVTPAYAPYRLSFAIAAFLLAMLTQTQRLAAGFVVAVMLTSLVVPLAMQFLPIGR